MTAILYRLSRLSAVPVALFFVALTAGCGGIPSAGLQPEYPPLTKGTFSLWADYVEVDSLQPTFRWQAFPREQDLAVAPSGPLGRFEDVTYELRIWDADPAGLGELSYARIGLTAPEHELEEALEPGSEYHWSVRAHFKVDGRPQTIGWGMAGLLLQSDTVPNPSCFRFKTPGPDGSEPESDEGA